MSYFIIRPVLALHFHLSYIYCQVMDKPTEAKTNTIVIKRQVQIEAISKAVYLVTDLFDADEPLRIGLRKTAVEAVASFDKSHAAESLQKLYSMIRIAKDIQLISEMNARLLMSAIESLKIKPEDHPVVDITGVLEPVQTDESDVSEVAVGRTGHVSEPTSVPQISSVYKPVPTPTVTASTAVQRTVIGYKSAVGDGSLAEKDRGAIQPTGLDIGSRRKKILEIVRAKGQVTINEFIEAIKGCSSKTIQRELTSLVLSGTLKKSGERRWSRYSLK